MGYTHYCRGHRAFTDQEWADFTADVKKLFASTDVPLGDFGGNEGSKPKITAKAIGFNGIGDDSYETAHISKSAQEFSFCKTAHRPYDEVVIEFYKLVRNYTGAELSSDGGAEVFA